MTNICFIGDGHIGALSAGWRQITKEFPGVQITFFGAGHSEMDALAVSEGQLVPTTDNLRAKLARSSGGEETISATFDLYVVCGLELHIGFSARTAIAKTGGEAGPEAIRLAIERIRPKLAFRTISKLQQCTQAPVFIIAAPCQPNAYSDEFRDMKIEDARNVAEVFQRACGKIAREMNVTFLPQPRATLSPGRATTRMRYARGPESLEGDKWHANGDYGAIVLRQILRRSASQPRVNLEEPEQI